MSKVHYILVFMILSASLSYASMLIYFHKSTPEQTMFVDAATRIIGAGDREYDVSSTTLEALGKKQLYLESSGLTITENRAIIGVMILALLIFGLVCFIAISERIKKGANSFQIPLVTLSMLLAVTFVSQSIWLGVF